MYYNVFLPKECQFCVVKNTKIELKIYYTSKTIESCMYSKTTNFPTDKGKFINRNSNQKTTGKLTPWMPAGKIILKTTLSTALHV